MKDLIVEYVNSVLEDDYALTMADSYRPERMITMAPLSPREKRIIEEVLPTPAR